eukprot:UN06044
MVHIDTLYILHLFIIFVLNRIYIDVVQFDVLFLF